MKKWLHRADLAESAINERHASRVWGFPNTNLAAGLPGRRTRKKTVLLLALLWQAHYLDWLGWIRHSSPPLRPVSSGSTGIRVRNLGQFTRNNYW